MLGQSNSVPNIGHLTIDGLTLTGGIAGNIKIGVFGGATVSGVTIQNCEIYGNNATGTQAGDNQNGVSINNCSGLVFQNNYVHDLVGYGAGNSDHLSGYLQWQTNGSIIQYNTFVKCGTGIYAKEGPQDGNTVRFNYVDTRGFTSGTIPCGIQDFSGAVPTGNSSHLLTRIYGNVILSGQPLMLLSNYTQPWSAPVNIYNNTCLVVASGDSGGLFQWTNKAVMQCFNNIIVNTGVDMHEGFMLMNQGAAQLADYNLYVGGPASWKTWKDSAAIYSSLSAWQSALAGIRGEQNSKTASSALFTGSGANALQYQLQQGSPARGAGRSNGTASGSVVDMGAWGNGTTQVGHSFGPMPGAPSLTVS
jgi:hypothetical protein